VRSSSTTGRTWPVPPPRVRKRRQASRHSSRRGRTGCDGTGDRTGRVGQSVDRSGRESGPGGDRSAPALVDGCLGLEQLDHAEAADDVSATRVKVVGEPAVAAPQVEDSPARDVSDVSIDEVVEPVDPGWAAYSAEALSHATRSSGR
jgi:hypothetical protein